VHPLGWLLAFLWLTCAWPALAAALLTGAVCWVLIMFGRGLFRI